MVDASDSAVFDKFIVSKSYVSGFSASQADVAALAQMTAAPSDKEVHALRWYNHISSFSAAVRAAWPAAGSEAASAAPVEAEEDDDDDLFGSDDEDDIAAAAALKEKMAAAATAAQAASKPKGARSLIVLDVKPYDEETDLKALALGIKEMTHEGIQNWGQEHKFEEIAYGIQKLIISLVVFDDLMGVDDITDLINSKYEDNVQSIDVAAFSKV